MIVDGYFVHTFHQIEFDNQILLIIFPKAYFILCKKNIISNMLDEGEKKEKKEEVISITLVYIKEELRYDVIKRQHIPYIKFRF